MPSEFHWSCYFLHVLGVHDHFALNTTDRNLRHCYRGGSKRQRILRYIQYAAVRQSVRMVFFLGEETIDRANSLGDDGATDKKFTSLRGATLELDMWA